MASMMLMWHMWAAGMVGLWSRELFYGGRNKGTSFQAHLIAQSANNLLLSRCCSTLVSPSWHGAFSPSSSSCAHLNSKSNTLKTVVPKSFQIFLSSISVLFFLLMIKAIGFFFFKSGVKWFYVANNWIYHNVYQWKDLEVHLVHLPSIHELLGAGHRRRKCLVGGFTFPLGAGLRPSCERTRKTVTAWVSRWQIAIQIHSS